ncbi:hypothetical protein P7C00_14385 [Pseudomonas sp. JDS08PS003]|uniref:hypothetical protein n=1 Tax=Pseudomonas TaxID=286 RepID=UPI003857AE45
MAEVNESFIAEKTAYVLKLIDTRNKINELLNSDPPPENADELIHQRKGLAREAQRITNSVGILIGQSAAEAVEGIQASIQQVDDFISRVQTAAQLLKGATAILGLASAIAIGSAAGIVTAAVGCVTILKEMD